METDKRVGATKAKAKTNGDIGFGVDEEEYDCDSNIIRQRS
jgi:hypothetical protein